MNKKEESSKISSGMQVNPFSIQPHVDKIDNLHQKCWSYYLSLIEKYPFDKSENADLRVAIFSLPGQALRSYLLSLTLIEVHLFKKIWWQQHSPNTKEPAIKETIVEHHKCINHTNFLLFLSRIECVLRNMIVIIKLGACNNGKAEFKSIYDCLLKEIGFQDLTVFFDIARELRNTIHNNGKYTNRSGVDSPTYSYRGRKIKFVFGKSIEEATSLSIEIMEDLINSCENIVNAPKISQIHRMDFVLDFPELVDVSK